VKKTAKSLGRISTAEKVTIFEVVIDDMLQYNEELSRGIFALMDRAKLSPAQAADNILQYFLLMIRFYPNVEQMKTKIIEPGFEIYGDEVSVPFVQHTPQMAESFVK